MKKVKSTLLILLSLLSISGFAQLSGDSVFTLLTGGKLLPNGKSWRLLSEPHAMGLGPIGDLSGSYYNFPAGLFGDAWEKGALANTYTFRPDSMYIPQNQKVTLCYLYANHVFGMQRAIYDDIQYEDPNHKQAPFIFKQDTGVAYTTNYRIEIQNGSYIGYFEERYDYLIAKISQDSMMLCQYYNDQSWPNEPQNDTLMRCMRFVQVPTVVNDLSPGPSIEPQLQQAYPNPATNHLYLPETTTRYHLYNSSGMEVATGRGSYIDLSLYPSGMYSLHWINKEGNRLTQRITKL